MGKGPRPSARVHRREVDEFHREIRAQQESIEQPTGALIAEGEMALANHPASVADSPCSAASLNPDESLQADSIGAVIEALQNRVMNMEAEARRANERALANAGRLSAFSSGPGRIREGFPYSQAGLGEYGKPCRILKRFHCSSVLLLLCTILLTATTAGTTPTPTTSSTSAT